MISSQNLEGTIGASWVIEATLGVALTGVALDWTLTRHGAVVALLTLGNGITVPNAAGKVAVVSVSPSRQQTAGIKAGLHEYRLRATVGGNVLDQASGIFYVRD